MAENVVTIDDVANSLVALGSRLEAQFQTHGWSAVQNVHTSLNWSGPSINIADIKAELEFAADRVRTLKSRKMTDREARYSYRLKERADEINVQNVSADFDALIGNVLEVANSVFRNFAAPVPLPPPTPKIDWENIKDERELLPKDLVRRLRHIESRLLDMEPRAHAIEGKISDIESAHQAAEQLPTDLAELASQKVELSKLVKDASSLGVDIAAEHTRVEDLRAQIEVAGGISSSRLAELKAEAENMIARSEQALRGATSVGLANAFDRRSKVLATSANWWVGGLAAALISVLLIGAERIHSLKDILNGDKPASVLWVNMALAFFGVGAPIWFAWLATKQIGTSFRLSEDYAFKASVSQAYEGYRAEAVQIDEKLRERLFNSALARLEESPIRLLESSNHSSPLSEILSNAQIRKSLEQIPGIAEKIIALIPGKGAVAAAVIAPAAAAGALSAALLPDDRTTSGEA